MTEFSKSARLKKYMERAVLLSRSFQFVIVKKYRQSVKNGAIVLGQFTLVSVQRFHVVEHWFRFEFCYFDDFSVFRGDRHASKYSTFSYTNLSSCKNCGDEVLFLHGTF